MNDDTMKINYDDLLLDVAYQPQIKTSRSTRSLMLDVIIALMPSLIAGVWQFGAHILIMIGASVCSCVFFEWAYRKLMKKDNRIGDLSAVVTGLILGLSMPCSVKWWVTVVGAFFAIVIVKQLYGGIGKNFLNPALAGRAFLLASYPAVLSTFIPPNGLTVSPDSITMATPWASSIDGVTMATPLTYLYGGKPLPDVYTFKNLFLGFMPGSVGEVSTLAILIGLAYLLIRRVISWRIPVSFIGTVALLTLIFGKEGYGNGEWMLYNLLTGSLLYGAVFMATDYATSPVTRPGQFLYGVGCGALTVFIRYFGGFPEGTTYGILIMNLTTWSIDKLFNRRQFGAKKRIKVYYSNRAEYYEKLAEKYRAKAGEDD